MVWAWCASGFFVVAIVLMATFGLPQQNTADRIVQACRERFPFGESARMDCEIRTASRILGDARQDRLDGAYRQAR